MSADKNKGNKEDGEETEREKMKWKDQTEVKRKRGQRNSPEKTCMKTTLAKRQMSNTSAQMDNKNYEKNEPSAPTQK